MAYRNYDTAVSHIVDPNGFGDFTTIGSALTAASSGQTIFIRPGTYTENPTLVAGVNLTAFGSDSSITTSSNVIIKGNCTLSTAGTVTISGVQFQTNSANCITVSGSAASILNLNNCFINCLNNTGISFTSSSSSSQINIFYCNGNLGTTSIGLYACSGSGTMSIFCSSFENSGGSTTTSTCSSGYVFVSYTYLAIAIAYSSTGEGSWTSVEHSTININTTCIAFTGTSTTTSLSGCLFYSGSATAITVGTGVTIGIYNSVISSSATNAISGAGTVNFSNISYLQGASYTNAVTTQAGGVIQGLRAGNAPSAGYIGEQIRNTGSSVSVSNNSPTTITSISITAGIWDVSGLLQMTNTGNVASLVQIGIGTTTNSFTGTTNGDSTYYWSGPGSGSNLIASIPSFRVTLSSTTIYYLVGQCNFLAGSTSCNGRISATRVG